MILLWTGQACLGRELRSVLPPEHLDMMCYLPEAVERPYADLDNQNEQGPLDALALKGIIVGVNGGAGDQALLARVFGVGKPWGLVIRSSDPNVYAQLSISLKTNPSMLRAIVAVGGPPNVGKYFDGLKVWICHPFDLEHGRDKWVPRLIEEVSR